MVHGRIPDLFSCSATISAAASTRFLAQPLADILVTKTGQNRRLIFTALYEAFFTYLKVSFFGAAFISFPVVATQVYMFVAPGLYRSEKKAFLPFLLATPVLFVAGCRTGVLLRVPCCVDVLPFVRVARWGWRLAGAA